MPKRFFKRYLPDHAAIRNHKRLRSVFGTLLHDPNLFHLNRRSVSGAFAVGLFIAFLPIFFQMVLAAAVAIWVRVNLPLSVSLVWITNPFTIPPIYYFTYKLGATLLQLPPRPVQFDLSLGWFLSEVGRSWQPVLLGSVICGVISGAVGYLLVRGIWRLVVLLHLRQRRSARRLRESNR